MSTHPLEHVAAADMGFPAADELMEVPARPAIRGQTRNSGVELSKTLSKEEQRAVAEDLTEEELAIFDLLTKPDPVLTDDERALVKASAKRLLSHLHDKLVLDWRRRAAATADVRVTILDVLDEGLPEDPYPPEVFDAKVQAVFDHILTAYGDDGTNVYDIGEVQEIPPSAGVAVLHDQDLASMTEAVVERIRTDAEFASLIADQLGLPGGRAADSRRDRR
jgi:type I restriction enzyme R subunit